MAVRMWLTPVRWDTSAWSTTRARARSPSASILRWKREARGAPRHEKSCGPGPGCTRCHLRPRAIRVWCAYRTDVDRSGATSSTCVGHASVHDTLYAWMVLLEG